jgi:hypothetical protein
MMTHGVASVPVLLRLAEMLTEKVVRRLAMLNQRLYRKGRHLEGFYCFIIMQLITCTVKFSVGYDSECAPSLPPSADTRHRSRRRRGGCSRGTRMISRRSPHAVWLASMDRTASPTYLPAHLLPLFCQRLQQCACVRCGSRSRARQRSSRACVLGVRDLYPWRCRLRSRGIIYGQPAGPVLPRSGRVLCWLDAAGVRCDRNSGERDVSLGLDPETVNDRSICRCGFVWFFPHLVAAWPLESLCQNGRQTNSNR